MPQSPVKELLEETAGFDPLALFAQWYSEAEQAGIAEPGAMALATASCCGEPSVRIVLLRGFDQRGFTFFTNYLSRKGQELYANPRAALAIYWPELERQVRIEGTVEKISTAESDIYWASRPLGHRLGALVSSQSQTITDRETLERRLEDLARRYDGKAVPRPAHWGGYRVIPQRIEFWQGRENRLHDRLQYRKLPDGTWLRERLAP